MNQSAIANCYYIKKEINKLIGALQEKGLTLVPLKMYLRGEWVKVSLGLGKGKKTS